MIRKLLLSAGIENLKSVLDFWWLKKNHSLYYRILGLNLSNQVFNNSSTKDGGNALPDSGETVQDVAVCTNTSGNPTIFDNSVIDASAGAGEYMATHRTAWG